MAEDTVATGASDEVTPVAPSPPPPSKPTDAEAALLKEVMKKKDLLVAAQAEANAAREALKRFEGIDPDAVRSLVDAQKQAEVDALTAKGDWERLRARIVEENAKLLGTKDSQIKALEAAVAKRDSDINDLAVGAEFSRSRFIPDELTLPPSHARRVYGDYFEVEDGQVVGYDKPRGSSTRTPLVDGTGRPLAFDAVIRTLVEADPDKDNLIRSKVKAGADSSSKPGAIVNKTRDQVNYEPGDVNRIRDALKRQKLI